MTDFDEKTRVTAVVQVPVVPKKTGNDCLVIIYSKDAKLLGRRFVLEASPTRVGRGPDNTIILEGDSVSRRHAYVERRSDRWWVVDDNSTNGTYVNDELVAKHMLSNGDRVKVGGLIFKFFTGEDVESQYIDEIFRMTIIDNLVQIYNKRYLDEAIEREVTRARRHERDLCVVMFDIDYFKKVNDQFGHLAGDYVLKELARVVSARIRRDEVFARFGGEEFALLLPETNLEGARQLCENLRQRVAENRFVFQGEHIPVTISLGAALLSEKDKGATELLQRADEKLYEAKRGGRNRVCA